MCILRLNFASQCLCLLLGRASRYDPMLYVIEDTARNTARRHYARCPAHYASGINPSRLYPQDHSPVDVRSQTGKDNDSYWQAKKQGIALNYSQTGKPQQNVYVERYNRTVRHEWRGHYGYYGRPHNYASLNGFYRQIRRIWFRCLRRRSQKSRRMSWSEFEILTARFALPVARITRTWAQARI
jgi:hypothetical protein